MKIVVAGGTGFLGGPLCEAWAEEGHDVRVLTRSLPPGQSQHESGTGVPGITKVGWKPNGEADLSPATVDDASAVINLAGESIASGRWTASRKKALRDSRTLATRSLAAAIRAASVPPRVFISGSAIGYYGDTGTATINEWSPPGHGFLPDICVEWENEALAAKRDGTRIVALRTGIALERSGGALPKMALPVRFFVGGRLASGRQYISWIHRLDWIEMVRWIVETPGLEGPINATAPCPVTNAEFTRALGRALHRPALIPAPRAALRVALGEMADSITGGQKVMPSRALQAGFHFRYPEIDIAMRGIYGME
jgi:uncharacterized protein (TIGR01777 family)